MTLTKPAAATTHYPAPSGYPVAVGSVPAAQPSGPAYPVGVESVPAAHASAPTYVPGKPGTDYTVHETATSTVYKYVTLSKVPVQYTPSPNAPVNSQYTPSVNAPANSQYAPSPNTPANSQYSPAPYAPVSGTVVYKPTGAASGTAYVPSNPYSTSAPLQYEGAASRFRVGVSALAVIVAGLLVL